MADRRRPATRVLNIEWGRTAGRHRFRQRPHHAAGGQTLIGLLVAVAVIVTLAATAIPNFHKLVRQHQRDSALRELQTLIATARQSAIFRREPTLLCPRGANSACGHDWTQGAQLLLDRNRNGLFEGREVYQVSRPAPAGFELTWRAFRRQNELRFQPSGYTAHQNGTFVLCPSPALADAVGPRVLTLNAQGRARRGRDRNADGIEEMPSGRNATC